MALRSDTTVVTWGEPFLQAPPDLSGVHTVVAGHGLCLTLGVPRIPEILAQPASVAVRGWEKAVLTAHVRGYALQMQWRKDGQIVPGATNSTLTIPASAVARAAGQYVLDVRNPTGGVTSDAATLSVLPGEPPGGAMVWGRGAQYVSADGPHEFVAVAADGQGFLLLQSDGRVLHCGTWPGAQPEILEEWSSVKAIARSENFSMFLRENGEVWRHGPFGPPQQIPKLRGAVAIAAGWDYSLGIMTDGTLLADRATLPPRLGPVRYVSAWADLAAAVQTNGELVVWGQGDANLHSLVREAPRITNALSAVLGRNGGLVLLSDGTVLGWPDPARVPRNLSDVVQIASGFNHELALRRDGTVAAFGDDSYGQISVPDGLSEVVSIAGCYGSSIAIGRARKAPEIRGRRCRPRCHREARPGFRWLPAALDPASNGGATVWTSPVPPRPNIWWPMFKRTRRVLTPCSCAIRPDARPWRWGASRFRPTWRRELRCPGGQASAATVFLASVWRRCRRAWCMPRPLRPRAPRQLQF